MFQIIRTTSIRTFSIFAILTALSGCTTLKVSQDYEQGLDFSTLHRFSWQDATQPETGDIRIDSPLIDSRIRKALEDALASKQIYPAVGDAGDFTVKYTYTILQDMDTMPVSTGMGIGSGVRGNMGGMGVINYNVSTYDRGLLVIDFLSAKTGKLLWRGRSTRMFHLHLSPGESTREIRATVGKILSQFPPEE